MNDSDLKKIFELKQEINKLLKEKPELKPLQDKIDSLMKNAGNQHNRCVLITELMKEKLRELEEHLKIFHTALVNFAIKKDK